MPIISTRLAKMVGLSRQNMAVSEGDSVDKDKPDYHAALATITSAQSKPRASGDHHPQSIHKGAVSSQPEQSKAVDTSAQTNGTTVNKEPKNSTQTATTPLNPINQPSTSSVSNSITATDRQQCILRCDNFVVTVVAKKRLQGPTTVPWQLTVSDGRQLLIFDTAQAVNDNDLLLLQSQLQRDGVVKLQILATSPKLAVATQYGGHALFEKHGGARDRLALTNHSNLASHLAHQSQSQKPPWSLITESLSKSAFSDISTIEKDAHSQTNAKVVQPIQSLSQLDHWFASRLKVLQTNQGKEIDPLHGRNREQLSDLTNRNGIRSYLNNGSNRTSEDYFSLAAGQPKLSGGRVLTHSLTELKGLLPHLIDATNIDSRSDSDGITKSATGNDVSKINLMLRQLADLLLRLPNYQQLDSAKVIETLVQNSPTLFESDIMQTIKSALTQDLKTSNQQNLNTRVNLNHTLSDSDISPNTSTPEYRSPSKTGAHERPLQQLFTKLWNSHTDQPESKVDQIKTPVVNHQQSVLQASNKKLSHFSSEESRRLGDGKYSNHAGIDTKNVTTLAQNIRLQRATNLLNPPLNNTTTALNQLLMQRPSLINSGASAPENFTYPHTTRNADISILPKAFNHSLKPLLTSLQNIKFNDMSTSNTATMSTERQLIVEQAQKAIQQSLAAIELEQYRSIPRDEFSSWSLPLIFQHQNTIHAVDLDWKKTQLEQSLKQPNWRLTLHFDLDQLGCFDMVLQLSLPSVEVTMLSESTETRQQLQQQLTNLSERLERAGITVTSNKVRHGHAPRHQPLISHHTGLNILT